MKINAFKNYRTDYPEDQIICLNDFNSEELKLFCETLQNVISGIIVNLHEQEYISKSECGLSMELSENPVGLKEMERDNYTCFLNKSGYEEMISLIKHFLEGDLNDNHFQWLYDNMNPIDLLLSNKCRW